MLKHSLILDGAMGTALQRRGMPVGACTERWALENPELTKKIQREYVDAGAQAVFAPTFGCNRASMKKYGLENNVREYCLRLVELSREAVDGRALVIGDMSPSGMMLEPFGEATVDEVVETFAEQARALEEAGVDMFGIETQISANEARAIVSAVKSVSDKPVLVSFSCNERGMSFFGDDLADTAQELSPLGIDAFGINCCGNLDLMIKVLGEISAVCELPLIAKPNAGLPHKVNGAFVYDMSAAEIAARVPELHAAGARLIGGCCGTTSEHIAAIAGALRGV